MAFRFETANERWCWYKFSNEGSTFLSTLENISATIKSGNRAALNRSETGASDQEVFGIYLGILKGIKYDLLNASYTDEEDEVVLRTIGRNIKKYIDEYLPAIDNAISVIDQIINGKANEEASQKTYNNVATGLVIMLQNINNLQEQIKNNAL